MKKIKKETKKTPFWESRLMWEWRGKREGCWGGVEMVVGGGREGGGGRGRNVKVYDEKEEKGG